MTMSHQIENINKELEIFKRINGILELKSTIIKMKNSLEELRSRFELAEERTNEFADTSIEVMQSKECRRKRR